MSDKNDKRDSCLICFPLDCGVITLAVITILTTIIGGIGCLLEKDAWVLYWPMIISYIVMSAIWISAYTGPDECFKHRMPGYYRVSVFIGWVSLVIIVARVYYLYIILNGKLLEHICKEYEVDK